jgi:sigma-E factor negative regulatory protein RseA
MKQEADMTSGTARGTAATLSAYMDGELPLEQHSPLLQSVKADQALCADWHVYHCIGDVLRSTDAAFVTGSFAYRIKAQLAVEPVLFAPEAASAVATSALDARPMAPAQRWRKPIGIAASVAALVAAGLLVLPQREAAQTAQSPLAPTQLPVAPMVAATAPVSPAGKQAPAAQVAPGTGALSAAAEDGVRPVSSEYLMAHRHYSTGLAMRGVVSHVRTAGYDGQ